MCLRFRPALATCDESGFKAVNRNVGGSNPPPGSQPLFIQSLGDEALSLRHIGIEKVRCLGGSARPRSVGTGFVFGHYAAGIKYL